MGVWGTGLFSDDTACDVRENWVDLVGDGLSGVAATQKLVREWEKSLHDPDEGPVFWLALAATQWKKGRLEDLVLRHALEVIDSGADLARWVADPGDHKKRKTVLEKLRKQLTSPQPREARIAKRFRDSNEWSVGELVSYQLVSGRKVIFRVIGHNSDRGGIAPICELLDWVGFDLPDGPRAFSVRRGGTHGHIITQLMIGRVTAKERPEARLCRIGAHLKPSQKPGRFIVTLWRYLDKVLKKDFGLE